MRPRGTPIGAHASLASDRRTRLGECLAPRTLRRIRISSTLRRFRFQKRNCRNACPVPRKNAIDAAREGAMEEAALPRTADDRRAALDATEQREETAMRVEHAAQVERFQRRLVMEALGVRGGSSDEVRHKTRTPNRSFRDFGTRAHASRPGRVTSVRPSRLRTLGAVSDARKR